MTDETTLSRKGAGLQVQVDGGSTPTRSGQRADSFQMGIGGIEKDDRSREVVDHRAQRD